MSISIKISIIKVLHSWLKRLKEYRGVTDSYEVDAHEAYNRMVKILGKDVEVLKDFDGNPFSNFNVKSP